MMRLPTSEMNALRQAEVEHSLVFAAAFGVVMLMLLLLGSIIGVVIQVPADWLKAGILLVFLAGGLGIGAILITGLRRGRGHMSRMLTAALDYISAEIEHKFPIPPEPKAPEAKGMPITTNVSNPELIGGIDVRDLDFLCRYMAGTGKWTAEKWEGLPLLYSNITITNKDTRDGQGNLKATTYANLIKLWEDAGLIRDRAKGETGTLTETNPSEMLRKIRQHIVVQPPPVG